MLRWIRQSTPLRGLLAASMTLALLVRIIVPVGFMPTAVSDKVVILLCQGGSAHDLAIELDNNSSGQKHKAADSPCIFAGGFSSGALASIAPAVPVPDLFATASLIGTVIADLVVYRLASPPPPAQAPPTNP